MERKKQNKIVKKVLSDINKNCGASNVPLEYGEEVLVEYAIKKTIEIVEAD